MRVVALFGMVDEVGAALSRRASFKRWGRLAMSMGAALAGIGALAPGARATLGCCCCTDCSTVGGCGSGCYSCAGNGGFSGSAMVYCWSCGLNGGVCLCYDCYVTCNDGSQHNCCTSSSGC